MRSHTTPKVVSAGAAVVPAVGIEALFVLVHTAVSLVELLLDVAVFATPGSPGRDMQPVFVHGIAHGLYAPAESLLAAAGVDDHELVAAGAVGLAFKHAADVRRRAADEHISGAVAFAVVGGLEAVDVEAGHA